MERERCACESRIDYKQSVRFVKAGKILNRGSFLELLWSQKSAMFRLVGVARLERAASRTPCVRSNHLNYTPTAIILLDCLLFVKLVVLLILMTDVKEQSIKAALEQIEKQWGKGTIMRLGDRQSEPIEVIPTGSIALDLALGAGGIPRGRVTEVFGPESSGKTTLVLHIIAQAQKMGGVAAFIDAEHALDPLYVQRIGVDLANLYLSQPDTGEQALEIADTLVKSGAVDIIAVDSVAALVPRAEIEGEMGDVHMGLQARLMSQALRKLTAAVARSKTALVFINQLRHKIGVMFGNPEFTPGGLALKFYSSVRLDIRRIGAIKEGETDRGFRAKVKVVKNKVAPPFKIAEFDIFFNEGISYETGLLDVGAELGVVKKSGAWFQYHEEKLGQGREAARLYLREHEKTGQEIYQKILEQTKTSGSPLAIGSPGGAIGANSDA